MTLIKLKQKKPRRHNLKELEDKALAAYAAWVKRDNESTRTVMFNTIQGLAAAVLEVGTLRNQKLDVNETAYEYALYLFERLITKRFKLNAYDKKSGRFPLQHYVRQNIRHVVFSKKSDTQVWKDAVSDLEFMVNEVDSPEDLVLIQADASMNFDHMAYGARLLDAIRVFYSYDEIRRLLPIAMESIFSDGPTPVCLEIPDDVRDFNNVLIAMAKRLVRVENVFYGKDVKKGELKKVFAAATRSTTFLATIVNTKFIDKELLLALDIDSLYRMCAILGGRTIKVPHLQDLNTLIGATVAASKMILHGTDKKKAVKEAKREFELAFSPHVSSTYFISKAVESFNVFKDEKSADPVINVLVASINSMNVLFKNLEQTFAGKTTEAKIRHYAELSRSLTQLSEGIIRISTDPEFRKAVAVHEPQQANG